ncbi:MAG: hypothetical protein OHK0029_40420 [Armatimonadaceae bacterium]
MTLAEIQKEIAALPMLIPADGDSTSGEGTAAARPEKNLATPLEIVSRQGRLLLRLAAATETLEQRYHELEQRYWDLGNRLSERNAQVDVIEGARRDAERKTRQMALEAIRLLDTLDWVMMALQTREDGLEQQVASAQKECLRRLAGVGITEIAAEGLPDGRLHESVDTLSTDEVPQYHIVSVVRRGYQYGPEVLRRAEVITAA